MRYLYWVATLSALILACTAPVHNYSKVGYVNPNYSISELRQEGIALLPVVAGAGQEGYRRPLGDYLNLYIDSLVGAERFVQWEEAMQSINSQNLTTKYQDAISAYTTTAIIDKGVLNEIGQAIGVKYLMFVSLGTFHKEERTSYNFFTGFSTHKSGEVNAFVQIWDAFAGDVVWEGNAIAASEGSGELTSIQGYEEHAKVAAKGIAQLIGSAKK